MSDNEQKKDKGWWNILGQILSLVLVLAYALSVANSFWPFIPAGHIVLKILNYALFYGPMILVIIVNFEFFADKNMIFRILILVLWAAIIVLSFFPDVVNLFK